MLNEADITELRDHIHPESAALTRSVNRGRGLTRRFVFTVPLAATDGAKH
jgi:hypothetical protein